MNKFAITIIIVVLIVAGYFIFQSGRSPKVDEQFKTSEEKTGKRDLDRFLSMTFTNYDSETVSFGNFEGKPMVVNSWAVWCPFCVKELSDFAALQKAFPDEVTVIAIDRAESLEKVQRFTNELGVSEDMIFLMDKKDDFYKTIGGFSMPETVFIDTNGAIVFHKRGPMTLDEMRAQVEKMLDKK